MCNGILSLPRFLIKAPAFKILCIVDPIPSNLIFMYKDTSLLVLRHVITLPQQMPPARPAPDMAPSAPRILISVDSPTIPAKAVDSTALLKYVQSIVF